MTLKLIHVNIMLINVNNKEKKTFLILIYVNVMLIYVNITDRRTDKHIKSTVWNITKYHLRFFKFSAL